MCGITGYVNLSGRAAVSRRVLEKMTDRLTHRGPDACGYHVVANVGLGCRRLSIIDVPGGDQPIYNEDRSVVLVCNGEVFNHVALRERLEKKGHSFRSSCDVEVLVHLYEEQGMGLVNEINGQFAFAIYDHRRGQLFIARDHFGINPLFYAVVDGVIIFGSEIKSILQHPLVSREVDLEGLDQVLTFPGLVSPTTMFRGVTSLPPGHYLTADASGVKDVEYWDLVYPEDAELVDADESYYVEELKSRFLESVSLRLQSDVPVGLYLSGGLDSALVAGAVGRLRPEERLNSFSIRFADSGADESPYQRKMLESLPTRHHEVTLDWTHIADGIHEAVYHAEMPLKESYNVAFLALSREAKRNGVSVILTGQGSDELFAGYVGYKFDRLARANRIDRGGGVDEERLREELWGSNEFVYERDYHSYRATRKELYSDALRSRFHDFDCTRRSSINRDRIRGRHYVHQRSYLDFKLRLADHLLSDHSDRTSMANSVESRHPFLDIDLVRLALETPPHLKLNGLSEKYVVKKIAQGLVPEAIISREKFGWYAHDSSILLKQGVHWIDELLSEQRIRRDGYFDPAFVMKLAKRYRESGFRLSMPFETDILMIVITFCLFVDIFDMPRVGS